MSSMFAISKPTGPFSVGQCDCLWVDEATVPAEQAGSSAKPRHKLMVRVYYPVEAEVAAKCQPGTWLPESYGMGSYAEAYAQALFKPGVVFKAGLPEAGRSLVGTFGFVPMMSNVATQTGTVDIAVNELSGV